MPALDPRPEVDGRAGSAAGGEAEYEYGVVPREMEEADVAGE